MTVIALDSEDDGIFGVKLKLSSSVLNFVGPQSTLGDLKCLTIEMESVDTTKVVKGCGLITSRFASAQSAFIFTANITKL